MIPEKKKKIVSLLGNDRDATVEFFFSLHCSHSASSLEDRKTTKAEAKPHGALFMRGGVATLPEKEKKMAQKIGPTESVPAEGFILDCTR